MFVIVVLRAKSHWRAISDLFWTNRTWNRPVTKNLSGRLQSHLRTKSVNKHHAMLWAPCDFPRFPAKPPLLAVYIHKIAARGISKYVTTKNSRSDCFLLFSGSSTAGKYQFNDTLPVIYAEFTSTKLAIDTMYSPSTEALSKTSTILLDSSSSSRIVIRDPLPWSNNTRGLLSEAFTN